MLDMAPSRGPHQPLRHIYYFYENAGVNCGARYSPQNFMSKIRLQKKILFCVISTKRFGKHTGRFDVNYIFEYWACQQGFNKSYSLEELENLFKLFLLKLF